MSTSPHIHPTTAPCGLWQGMRAQGLRTVAVMGMTKNTGKTVSLNHLLAQAHQERVNVGFTSIGRDGEEHDQVFSIPKPPVQVTHGNLVATARDTLLRARARFKQIDTTGVHSPMGEIVIVKVLDAGDMEVAGASRSHDQHKVIGLLRQWGADMIFLDGALGRSHHASPAMADGVVLATGAALGGGMDDVLRKTSDRLAILGIPAASPELLAQVQPTFDKAGVGIWNAQGACLFNEAVATLNAAPTILAHKLEEIGTIAVSGAVGMRLWRALQTVAQLRPGLQLVVSDGTKLFVDASELHALERMGASVMARRPVRLVGITLNPCSPFGGSFDAQAFLARARQTFPHHIVTDVLLTKEET